MAGTWPIRSRWLGLLLGVLAWPALVHALPAAPASTQDPGSASTRPPEAAAERGPPVVRRTGDDRPRGGHVAPMESAAGSIRPAWPALAAMLVAGLAALAWRARHRRRAAQRSHLWEIERREDRLRLALWGSGDDFWDWNLARDEIVITAASDLARFAEWQPGSMTEQAFLERLHPDDRGLLRERLQEHLDGKTVKFELECRIKGHRNDWAWLLVRGKVAERDTDGRPLRVCGTARNVSAVRVAEQERRIAHGVLDSMAEAVAVTDLSLRFLTVNPAFTRMTGWRQDEVAGQPIGLMEGNRQPGGQFEAMRHALLRSGYWRGELWLKRKDDVEFLSWSKITDVRDAAGVRSQFVAVISDITDRKRTERELRYLANYDPLTGLANRSLLSDHIARAIARATRRSRRVAVLFLDLDRFKHINDSMGHATGDRVLRAAGHRLRDLVRQQDSVARLGGDEFTVVLDDMADATQAEQTAREIIAAFEQPLHLDNGQEVFISPSIGISLFPDHGHTPSELLKFADTAMYQAKELGRRTWLLYTPAMDAAARLRANMIAALRKAVERGELSLAYQPRMSLLDDRITGVEALLRWRSAEFGDVSPGVFIPIAEETGLIIEIGNWVVDQACMQLAAWRQAGLRELSMSINISVAQLLRGNLIRHLREVLARHDVPPNRIELELTESMVMANAERSITTLRQLKTVGVSLAIDDFGTGYSSLSYLKRLPIDTLKIDKEFVGDITSDPDDEAITATVIMMAHSLGLNVIAEGVERSEQLEYLREQDCDEIQGHWLSFPLPPGPCQAFLHERTGGHGAAVEEALG